MPNRLAHETSPYLLQHAGNPVHWQPWDKEALEQSEKEGKPIFLSIGYSACHWCHVMEHESFENEDIAAYLNEHFISIKVDREERPDLDQIYMAAVQLLTGRGGWPMSVFLTPALKPFYGGTYWPPTPSRGMPGFLQVLQAVEEAWRVRRDSAVEQSEQLTKHIEEASGGGGSEAVTPELLRDAVSKLHREFDPANGGFGHAPKFPHSMDIQFLLRMWRRNPHPQILQIVETTLDKMALGGIYDHLAGGFARYSVDEKWLVPHFEKMLYDNALLISAYTDAYLVTKKPLYERVIRECGDYLLTNMRDPAGGFHSTEDADSEGEEGKFYVWSRQEVINVLGEDRGQRFCTVFDVTDGGNFEGHNILHLSSDLAEVAASMGKTEPDLRAEMDACRSQLRLAREKRIRPGKDDKILTSWNALAISAFAKAGRALGEPSFITAAQDAARFILSTMRDQAGILLHTYRAGMARQSAFLDDYAYMVSALVDMFEADGDQAWITEDVALADTMLRRFADPAGGGFYYTAEDQESLITRQKDSQDQSIPSGNGMAATGLLRLGALTGNNSYINAAQRTLEKFSSFMKKHSLATGQMLIAADWLIGPRREVVLVLGSDQAQNELAQAALRAAYLPRTVQWIKPDKVQPILPLQGVGLGKVAGGAGAAEPRLYVCEGFACQSPVEGQPAIEAKLKEIALN